MVAQVVKLSSVATNNFQTGQSGSAAKVVTTTSENIQADRVKAKELAKQAAQNIEVVREAAKDLNEFAQKIQTNLSFSVDEASGRSIITVIDTQSGEVIRQIPAKEVLAVANLIRESTASDVEKVGLLLAAEG